MTHILSTTDHRRDSAQMTYVYPVISRRAGGVSVGINLNTNNACNWACVYCQVENLTRGGPPPVDLALLESELKHFLWYATEGNFMAERVPPEARRLVDIAFSGNGEPTSAPEFPDAVQIVTQTLSNLKLVNDLPLRVITNGSLMHRKEVQTGIGQIGEFGGEVWFKLDRASETGALQINRTRMTMETVSKHLDISSRLATTWVQTCWFSMDGLPPSSADEANYIALLTKHADKLAGMHLYGIARPSMQPEAVRLSRIAPEALEGFAQRIHESTGLVVRVSP